MVLGVSPTRPETGYGYIELGAALDPIAESGESIPVRRVKRFTEKPDKARRSGSSRRGTMRGTAGCFCGRAKTLADAMREHQPEMAPLLEKIAAAWGTPEFEQVFAELYPQCENDLD